MRKFVEEALAALGHRYERLAEGLVVETAASSALGKELGEGMHRFVFSPKHVTNGECLVIYGSRVLETLHRGLRHPAPARHFRASSPRKLSRKEALTQFTITTGTLEKMSTTGVNLTTTYAYVKTAILADDMEEKIVAVEVDPHGTARIVEEPPHHSGEGAWLPEPPLPRRVLKERLYVALRAASLHARERAGKMERKVSRRLYRDLENLKGYYAQLEREVTGGDSEERKRAVREEFEIRKRKEVDAASLCIKIGLVGMETVSWPGRKIHLLLRNGETKRNLALLFDEVRREYIASPRCEACEEETWDFGLSRSGKIVCPFCIAECKECKAEIVLRNAVKTSACGICGRHMCEDHLRECGNCGIRLCPSDLLECVEGCAICTLCAHFCQECGKVLCRDHVIHGVDGDLCKHHATVCSQCQEPHSRSKSRVCAQCGRVLCARCATVCRSCGNPCCSGHVDPAKNTCPACGKPFAKQEQLRLFRP